VDLRLALVLLVVIATTGVADEATPTVPTAWRPAEVHFLDRAQGMLALAVRPSRLHALEAVEPAVLRLPAPITQDDELPPMAGGASMKTYCGFSEDGGSAPPPAAPTAALSILTAAANPSEVTEGEAL
jgi:hypothetical protein